MTGGVMAHWFLIGYCNAIAGAVLYLAILFSTTRGSRWVINVPVGVAFGVLWGMAAVSATAAVLAVSILP